MKKHRHNGMRQLWRSLSIDRKVRLFAAAMVVAVILVSAFNMAAVNYGYAGFGQSLSDISRSQTAEAALRQERSALEGYMRQPTESAKTALENAITHTKSSISLLPEDYERLGDERYAKLWSIRNAYRIYEQDRDAVRAQSLDVAGTVPALYHVYRECDYLEEYLQSLTSLSVTAGSRDYESRADLMQSMPYLMVIVTVVLVLILVGYWRFFAGVLVTPIQNLAAAVRRIGRGDFSGEDVSTVNQDELGELVEAVNGMKHATEANIRTLQENQKLSDQLHEEELNRVQMEKVLETTRLDLLQSQINPHFLFNTLNMINGMAELEDAGTTGKMIRSLSNIFRYNLHTNAQFVTLTAEMQVVWDYMYLQQMRFGSRLQYIVDVQGVDTDQIMIPVFLLQPLVENAVVHGVTQKEEGGKVTVGVRLVQGNVVITVADTGAGMSPAVYQELMNDLRSGQMREEDGGKTKDTPETKAEDAMTKAPRHRAGIGMSNVYQRIHQIYKKGSMTIETKEGEGTTVTLVLPQDEKIITEETDQHVSGDHSR